MESVSRTMMMWLGWVHKLAGVAWTEVSSKKAPQRPTSGIRCGFVREKKE